MALKIAKKPLPPTHRVILDHLCKSPARVFDFTEVAEATKAKRGDVEKIIRDLRHQRFGSLLSDVDPTGFKLRPRFAYLPASSPARVGYAAVADTTVTGAEHPALAATKRASEVERVRLEGEAAQRRENGMANAVMTANYKKAKADARASAAENAVPRSKIKSVTGMIFVPEGAGPIGPPMPVESPPTPALAADKDANKPKYSKAKQ